MGPIERLQTDGVIDNSPPPARTRLDNHATLLVSWWCTGCALVLILLRLWGRMVRTGRLFSEDKIMAVSIVPLLIRMALVDPLMLYDTNNTITTGLTTQQIHNRAIGSKLVLPSRIFYAMFIWVAKFTVSEYLKRLTQTVWTKMHQRVLGFIRIFLVVTFSAVVIATLSECQPFAHYWQVTPDPGPRCRTGYAQLLVMGICDIITDILLIAFPISIIVRSTMPFHRKISICSLFALSFLLIGITAYRMPAIIHSRGRQQLRTLWASLEVLAAAAVSNAVILGSFLRDRGVKKQKYRGHNDDAVRSASNNEAQSNLNRSMTRRHWGSDSDEDLFSALRGRLDSVIDSGRRHPQTSGPENVPPKDPYRDEEIRQMARNGSLSGPGGHRMPHSTDTGTSPPRLLDIGGILSMPKVSSSSSNDHDSHAPLCPSPAATREVTQQGQQENPSSISAFDFADVGGLLPRREVYSNTTSDIPLSPLEPARRRDSLLTPNPPLRPRKSSAPDSFISMGPSSKRSSSISNVSSRGQNIARTADGLGISSASMMPPRSSTNTSDLSVRDHGLNDPSPSPHRSTTSASTNSSITEIGATEQHQHPHLPAALQLHPRSSTNSSSSSSISPTSTTHERDQRPSRLPFTADPASNSDPTVPSTSAPASNSDSQPKSDSNHTLTSTNSTDADADTDSTYDSQAAARALLAKIKEATDARLRPTSTSASVATTTANNTPHTSLLQPQHHRASTRSARIESVSDFGHGDGDEERDRRGSVLLLHGREESLVEEVEGEEEGSLAQAASSRSSRKVAREMADPLLFGGGAGR